MNENQFEMMMFPIVYFATHTFMASHIAIFCACLLLCMCDDDDDDRVCDIHVRESC